MKRRSFLALPALLFLPSLAAQPASTPEMAAIPFNCSLGETAFVSFYVEAPCTFRYGWGYIEHGIYLEDWFTTPFPSEGIVFLWFFNSGSQQLQGFGYHPAPVTYEFASCVL